MLPLSVQCRAETHATTSAAQTAGAGAGAMARRYALLAPLALALLLLLAFGQHSVTGMRTLKASAALPTGVPQWGVKAPPSGGGEAAVGGTRLHPTPTTPAPLPSPLPQPPTCRSSAQQAAQTSALSQLGTRSGERAACWMGSSACGRPPQLGSHCSCAACRRSHHFPRPHLTLNSPGYHITVPWGKYC
jgi:hypothetical protein